MSAVIPTHDPASPSSTRRAIAGLGITALIGWGSTFTPLQVLGPRIGADLNLSPEAVFAGITIMMLTSAVLAPRIGRRIDAHGARSILIAGSLMMALGMVLVATAQGFLSYALGWFVVGVALPLALTSASVPALVQIAGPTSRRAVTALSILTGVTSTIFMPVSAWFEARYGWRACFLGFAALHLCVCLPIHGAVLPRGRPARHASADAAGDASWTGQLPDNKRRGAFWLLALWTSVEALVVWGFNMQAVNVFMALGLGQAAAIGAWMLSGPSQALIRTGELISGSRYSIFAVGLISAVLAPIGLTIFLATGATAGTAAMLAILFGSGLGLYSIARQVIPLRLFGIAEFGSISGRLTLPQNVATAIAPLLFAAVLSHAGPLVAVALALVFSCIALCALIALIRLAQGSSGPTSDG